MRVADFIAQCLLEHGITHCFLVTGGGAMHLNDAMGRNSSIKYICCHHEQACAIAAESYTRLSGRVAALNVTTGPGGINALNGVFGAYTDSIGMVIVSGQVKRETLASRSLPMRLRQLGDQEVDIVSMVRPITKYAVTVQEPGDIRYELEKAIHLARSGRPGPVWVDVPIDIQATPIDPEGLRGFDPMVEGEHGRPMAIEAESGTLSGSALEERVAQMLDALRQAERPVILAGGGVRVSGAHTKFIEIVDRLGIPVTTGWNAHDAIWDDHPQYVGRPSSVGDRAGNFAVQNSDYLLVLGSRLNIRQISFNFQAFARAAYKVMVDVDKAELSKPTLSIDLPIHADLNDFLAALDRATQGYQRPEAHGRYLGWCKTRRERYPTVLPEYWETQGIINPYCFVSTLYEQLQAGEAVVCGDGTACVVPFQAAHLKVGQRLYTNSGCASMGYDLPAAIGAWHTGELNRVICIAGDGSIMMNLQELETISGQGIPAKIFVFNNNGYHSIRQTQQSYFPDNVVGCGPESGLTFPDFCDVAKAFRIPARRCTTHQEMGEAIRETLTGDGPQLCEVMIDGRQFFSPKLTSRKLDDGSMVSSPLEDLWPFLSREELAENMLIPTWS